jgi:hypothetical protein
MSVIALLYVGEKLLYTPSTDINVFNSDSPVLIYMTVKVSHSEFN